MRRRGKPLKEIPMTPRMKYALAQLAGGDSIPFAKTSVGRPTKQRLAKYGLAEYLEPRGPGLDWDGPMKITNRGRRALERAQPKMPTSAVSRSQVEQLSDLMEDALLAECSAAAGRSQDRRKS